MPPVPASTPKGHSRGLRSAIRKRLADELAVFHRASLGLTEPLPGGDTRLVASGPCSPGQDPVVVLGLVAALLVPTAAPPSPARQAPPAAPATIPLPTASSPRASPRARARPVRGLDPHRRDLEGRRQEGHRQRAGARAEGRAAIGVKVDRRAKRIVVAGGPTGKAFVYGARDGRDIAQLQLAPAGQETFVNDVMLTRRGAFFTDSRHPADLPRPRRASVTRRIPLTGDIAYADRQQRQRHRVGQGRQGPDHAFRATRASCSRSTPTGVTDEIDLGGAVAWPTATACCCRAARCRGPEPPEQDRGRRACRDEPEVRPGRARAHQPRVRRAHHAGPEPAGGCTR